MLVLSRRRDEAICLGDEVRVRVIEVRGDKVRLGIDAPRNVAVHREEVRERILAARAAEIRPRAVPEPDLRLPEPDLPAPVSVVPVGD